MKTPVAKRLRLLASVVSILLVLAVLWVGWFYWRVRSSLPQLSGTAAVPGLTAPVAVERDENGVPRIRGTTRADVHRALGWLHAQERFFQMDLLRRAAAGELAELAGKRALTRDRATRMHGFRARARSVVERLPAEHRALLDAYVAGVNAGLNQLGAKPFEYLVLRETPQPWRPEDTVLVIYAMMIDLQDENGTYERSLMTLRDVLGQEAVAFFAPAQTPDDAALDGSTAPLARIPTPRTLNLRTRKAGAAPAGSSAPTTGKLSAFPALPRDPEFVIGSNVFAVAGAHTASGAAMLASDMHLDHGVPNTWYRAALEYAGRTSVGVTLPGTPGIIAGSNGDIAWSFTNAYIDTSDLVAVEVNRAVPTLYTAPVDERVLTIAQRKETIKVHGSSDVIVEYPWTIWGPIVGTDAQERPLALRWIGHDPDAINLALVDLEAAKSVDEGLAVAHQIGIPAQNIFLTDRSGNIAWTIAGRIPKRAGYDGRMPVSWAFGDRKWNGYLTPAEMPVVRGAESAQPGRLWSGNQRMIGGEALARLGDGGYARPYRAAQIRDGLTKLQGATPKDLLAVQLDDRALFLERWHGLLMQTLTPAAMADNKPRTALRAYAEKWEGRASTDAVSYWLTREFRLAVYGLVFTPIFETCRDVYPEFSTNGFQSEPAMWTLLQERPIHLLNPRFASWDDLLQAACDEVVRATDKLGVSMDKANWGLRNTAQIRHPLSTSLRWLSSWLDMPADPLPGGDDMPRVQNPRHGASERMVVSPGREAEGIFHMPGGQSGHPLSPHYRAGHDAWVRGQPTPLLPGKPVTTVNLTP